MKQMWFAVGALALLAVPVRADKKIDDAVAKAEELIQKGKPEEALKTMQKAASQSPGAEGQSALARLQAKMGSLDDAAVSAAKAVELAASAPAPVKADALTTLADLDLRRGTGRDALAHAEEAVKVEANAATLSTLARAQARAGDAGKALETADRAVGVGGAVGGTHAARGDALMALRRSADATAAFRKALEVDPKLAAARIGLASALLAESKAAEAVVEARKASEADPKSEDAFAVLGSAILAENPKSWNDAIAQAQQGAFLNARSPRVLTAVGKIFEADGNKDQALSAYKKALETDPGYSAARLATVQLQVLYGDNKAVLAEAQKLAQEMPNNGEVQFLLGRAFMRANDFASALAPLEKAATLVPGLADAQALYGTAAFYAGKNDVAVAAYKRALQLKPDNVQWRTDYGLFLARNGDFEAGATELKKVVSTPGYKDSAGFVNLGYVYRNMKPPKLEESIQAYKKGLELDPKEEQAALGLGWAYLTAQRYDESIAAYNRVLQIEPKLAPDAYNGIGWSYFFKKDMAQAEAFAAKAKEAGRQDTGLFEQIGRFKKAMASGAVDTEKAIEEAKKARELASRFESINENLRSKNAGIRIRAIGDLVAATGAESATTLVWILANDKDWGVREVTARSLGNLGPAAKSAIPYLKTATAPCAASTIQTRQEMEENLRCEDFRRAAQQALAKVQR